MRIALFTDTYPPQINGVATSTYNLKRTLTAHGHQVLVIAPNANEAKFEVDGDLIKIPGFVLKKLYGYRGTWIFSTKAFTILKDFKPEVIHCQTDAPIGQFSRIVARRLNVPFIYTYHTQYEDYTYYVTHGYFDRVAKKTMRSYSLYITRYANEFITPSEKTKEMLRQYGADNYINVIPTGIDFSLFNIKNMDLNQLNEIKKSLDINEDDFIFLVLGRLAKEKSIDISINGFDQFHKAHPEIKTKLIIVGGGPHKNELEMQVEKLGIDDVVRFVGPVSADMVPYYYHLANIYNSASITETQGLTFMEAMASGAIVLARFDDNLTGTIEDNETGFFFTSEKSFVEKAYQIYQMSEKAKEKIINNAYKIIEKYSIETFYKKIMEVYQRAIKTNW